MRNSVHGHGRFGCEERTPWAPVVQPWMLSTSEEAREQVWRCGSGQWRSDQQNRCVRSRPYITARRIWRPTTLKREICTPAPMHISYIAQHNKEKRKDSIVALSLHAMCSCERRIDVAGRNGCGTGILRCRIRQLAVGRRIASPQPSCPRKASGFRGGVCPSTGDASFERRPGLRSICACLPARL